MLHIIRLLWILDSKIFKHKWIRLCSYQSRLFVKYHPIAKMINKKAAENFQVLEENLFLYGTKDVQEH